MSKNRNKILTQFDLSSAFTALSDMDYAAPEGNVKSFQENLVERKGYGKCFEPLFEDLYDLEDTQDLNDAADAREAEVAQAKLSRIEKIIDLDAKSPDELLPSYVGKIIVQCPQCMNLFYKDEADIEKDEEDPTLCNVGEECQHCGNTSGYTLIGKVDAATEEDLNQGMEAPAEETPVEEQPVEETPEETTEETGDEDLNLDDMDLDLNLDEEPAQESFNTNPDGQVLTENVEKLDEECLNKAITDFLLDDSSTHKSLDVILSDLYKAHPEAPAENVQSAMDGVLNVEWPLNKIETFGFCAKQHPYVEGLTEEVDKDLDKKLAEHDTYIDYLRKEIATLENSIKNEKNEEIKAAKQAHLDELNQSLDAALPEAVKNGSVEVNTENTGDTSDDNLDADDVLNGELNNEETSEENADQVEEQPISAPEDDEEDGEQVKESLTESVTIDVDDLEFCQMVNDGKINDVNKYNLGYTRLCELSQICVNNHLDRAYDIIEKAIDQITGYTEENSLTEDKRDDDDYYGRDIDDAVIQLKKRGHAEFWCRQGNEKAEEVKKIAKDKYNLDVEYTIDNDYCKAKVIKSKKESINEENYNYNYSKADIEAQIAKLKELIAKEQGDKKTAEQELAHANDEFLGKDEQAAQKAQATIKVKTDLINKYNQKITYWQNAINNHQYTESKDLNEAVAITISVDEVDDTVTPNANTMVFDNGDAGVAEYHADDNDVNNEDPFNQDFEPVEFNRPAFNPFASTEFDFDNEADETAIQNVEPEEMDDKKLDKSDEKELEKELDSEDDSDKKDDKDDQDDEDKSKKAKDESLTESVKNKLTEETLNEGPLNFIKKGIAKAFTSIMDPKFASTLDNFYKDQLATGGKYIVYCDKFMSGIQEGQNKQYKITTTFKDILNIIRQQSKAQPDATFTVLSPQTDVDQFVAAITKAQDEGNKNRKSQTFKLAYQDLMKIINSDTISEFVGGKQTEKGKNALKALYGSIKAGNGSFEDTSAQNAEAENSNTEVNNNQQNQNTSAQGTVDQNNTQNNNVQPAAAQAEPANNAQAENTGNTDTNASSTESQEAPKINPQELIKGLRAKYGDKYDGWKTMGNTLKTLDDAGLLSGEYNKEQWDDYDEYKNHRTESFNNNSNGTILTEAMSDEDYNRLFDSTTYGNKLSDFYDLSERCGEIFESTYQSLGYPMDDEWIIAPEILKDDNKVTELYNAVRKNVVDILNNGSRDELDDGHHGDVIGTLIDLFDINQVFETLDEAKDSKEIVDDVTDAEFKELINSDIFNEKCEDEHTEDKKITEDAELDNMLDKLDTEIDNVLNKEEQPQENSDKEEFDQEMLDEIDENGLEECLSKSLINIYENVENFKINDINLVNNRLIVEGKIKFNKSDNILDTKYIFNDIYKENDKLILNGYNKTLAEDCNLVLTGNIKDKKFITESFEYNYTVEGDKVHGKVNNN